MIILRHNSLDAQDLFLIERVMLKVSENPYKHSLDFSLLNKSRGEVYGFIAGIFKRIGICQTLSITASEFLDLLVDIEKGYNDNPYHSFYHAVDVAMVLYHMLEEYDMKLYLNCFDLIMVMLAALFHDIGHPGRNNQFEVSCKTKKALQYSNMSVLECHSSTLTLELLKTHNILRHLESKSRELGCPMTQDQFKASVVQMILATDMACHFSLKENIPILRTMIQQHYKIQQKRHKRTLDTIPPPRNNLKPLFPITQDPFLYFKEPHFISTVTTVAVQECINVASPSHVLNKQERLMMCQILIHAADVSNPCRPWPVFHQQSLLVCAEFFRQGEEELSMGLPVSPHMNQQEANLSEINVGFIDFVVQPYFEELTLLYPKANELVEICIKNRDEWLKLSTETLDARNIPSVNVALGGPIQPQPKHVTTAAGTVIIPEHILLQSQKRGKGVIPLNRSFSFNNLPWTPSTMEEQEDVESPIRKIRNQRRKSADTTMKQVYNKNRSLVAKARRKSEEIRAIDLLNQPKMVSFSNR